MRRNDRPALIAGPYRLITELSALGNLSPTIYRVSTSKSTKDTALRTCKPDFDFLDMFAPTSDFYRTYSFFFSDFQFENLIYLSNSEALNGAFIKIRFGCELTLPPQAVIFVKLSHRSYPVYYTGFDIGGRGIRGWHLPIERQNHLNKYRLILSSIGSGCRNTDSKVRRCILCLLSGLDS